MEICQVGLLSGGSWRRDETADVNRQWVPLYLVWEAVSGKLSRGPVEQDWRSGKNDDGQGDQEAEGHGGEGAKIARGSQVGIGRVVGRERGMGAIEITCLG